jgi:GNAT superfamily N-acetyltransferase
MDRFYGATETEPLALRIKQISEAIFGNPPAAHVLLAWDQDEPIGYKLIGFAAYSYLWPAVGLTRSLFLKELYVAETARHHSVGKRLMQRLHAVAIENGCSRVEWMTERTNANARQFYSALGALVDESKIFYRVQGDTLRQMSE